MITHFVGDDCPGGHADELPAGAPILTRQGVAALTGRSCDPCVTCGIACAKTDDGECWECSTELGEAGA